MRIVFLALLASAAAAAAGQSDSSPARYQLGDVEECSGTFMRNGNPVSCRQVGIYPPHP